MTREIPGHVHSFECTGVSEAITFHFRPTSDGKDPIGRVFGWALATVNNKTGELAIQSDWGNWSYRWHINALGSVHEGRPCTLVEFIAERDAGHCDYLADKLVSHAERNQFDEEKTVRELKRALIEQRLADARYVIEWYRDEDPEDLPEDLLNSESAFKHRTHKVWCRHTREHEQWPLTRDVARRLYDEIDGLTSLTNDRDFLEAWWQIEGHDLVCEDMDLMRYSPSPHYYQLLHGILPALVRACAERAKALDPAPSSGDHPDRVVAPVSR